MSERDEIGCLEGPRHFALYGSVALVAFFFGLAAVSLLLGKGHPDLELCLGPLVLGTVATLGLSRERDRLRPLLLFLACLGWILWFGALGASTIADGGSPLESGFFLPLGLALAFTSVFAVYWRELVDRLTQVVASSAPAEIRDPALGLVALAHELPGATVAHETLEATYRGRALRIALVREMGRGLRYEIRLATTLGAPRFGKVTSLATVPDLAPGGSVAGIAPQPHADRWRALFRIYAVREVEQGEGFLRANAASGAGSLTPEDEAQRLLRLLARLGALSEGSTELDLVARESTAARCPYCHDAFAARASGPPHLCAGCGTPHHADCFAELGGCAVMGCPEARGGRRAEPVRG